MGKSKTAYALIAQAREFLKATETDQALTLAGETEVRTLIEELSDALESANDVIDELVEKLT